MTKLQLPDSHIFYNGRTFILLLFNMFLLGSFLSAQETGKPFIRNYKPREYKASSANYAIVQDNRGILYFGNYKGVLEYDGLEWRLIPTSNRTQVRSLAVDSSGQVYIGALGEFGLLKPDERGQMQYQSLRRWLNPKDATMLEPVEVIGTDSGAWFRGLGSQRLFFWDGDSLSKVDVEQSEAPGQLFYINHELYYVQFSEGLKKWNGEYFEMVPGGQKLKDLLVMSLIPDGDKDFLALAYNKGIYRLKQAEGDLTITPLPTEIDDELLNNVFPNGMILGMNDEIIVGTTRLGIYVLDRKGRIIMHLKEGAGLQDNLVLGLLKDKKHSIWAGLSKGISRIEISSPWRLWDESLGLQGIVFSTMRHKGILYVATPLGVFYMENNHFYPVRGIETEVWQLLKIPPNEPGKAAKLLATSNRGLFDISDKHATAIYPGKNYVFLKLYRPPGINNRLYSIAGPNGLQVLERKRGKWQEPVSISGFSTSFGSIARDIDGSLWLLELLGEGSISRVDTDTTGIPTSTKRKRYGKLNGLPTVNGMFHIGKRVAFATEKGVFWYDKSMDRFVPDTTFGITDVQADKGVAHLLEGEDGNIWIERYQGSLHWLEVIYSLQNGQYQRDSSLLSGLINTEFWGEVYPEPQGSIWVGTPEGLIRFLPDGPLSNKDPAFPPLIREVKNEEDELIFGGKKIETYEIPILDHTRNSLSFSISAPYFQEEGNIKFSYFLKGWDESWTPWTSKSLKEYTLLSPGAYEFQVKAKNIYGRESDIASFEFRIAHPWYQSVWALMCYALLGIFLVYGTVKLNTQRLHLQNENLERIVYERTAEIWAQHKEIVKKSVALKRQKKKIAMQRNIVEEKNQELQSTLAQLKSAQAQLISAEKMASLGQLTAGIAHEINNPINFIKGNINPLKRDFQDIKRLFIKIKALKDYEDLREGVRLIEQYSKEIDAAYIFEEMELLLKGIEEGAVRTKNIVDGLKIFSRTDKDDFKTADIHQGLDATFILLANKLKDRIKVHRNYSSLPMVECLPGKLNQVFMNIISNAIQAIEEKGKLNGKLSDSEVLGEIFVSTDRIPCALTPTGECIQIRIKDTGMGIEEEAKKKIFDPFFTTKEIGEGTGLGLSISFGIVEKHHGAIEVKSEEGKGAEFIITLPTRQDGLEENAG